MHDHLAGASYIIPHGITNSQRNTPVDWCKYTLVNCNCVAAKDVYETITVDES